MIHFDSKEEIKRNYEEIWNFVFSLIKNIVINIGSRAPGSDNEKKCSTYLKNELYKFSNDVINEEFSCYPRMFNGWPRLSVIFTLISFFIFFAVKSIFSKIFASFIAILTITFLIYIIWRQFFCYDEFVNKFIPYRKKQSQNIYGIIKPRGEIKKRLIFAGHYDSSFQFNLIEHSDVGYTFFIIGGVFSLIILFICYMISLIESLINTDLNEVWVFILCIIIFSAPIIGIIVLVVGKNEKFMFGAFSNPSKKCVIIIIISILYSIIITTTYLSTLLPKNVLNSTSTIVLIVLESLPYLISLFFFLGKNAVPGVIDNLSACGVVMALANILAKWKEKKDYFYPENTEIWFLFTGAEEAGDIGSENFSFRHAEELNSIETKVFNFESISDGNLQKIVTLEKTTNTKCDPDMFNLISICANELDIHYKLQELPTISGGTDIEGFVKGGFKASGLEGIRYSDYLHWYHSTRDSIDILDYSNLSEEDKNLIKLPNYKKIDVKKAIMNAILIAIRYLEKYDENQNILKTS